MKINLFFFARHATQISLPHKACAYDTNMPGFSRIVLHFRDFPGFSGHITDILYNRMDIFWSRIEIDILYSKIDTLYTRISIYLYGPYRPYMYRPPSASIGPYRPLSALSAPIGPYRPLSALSALSVPIGPYRSQSLSLSLSLSLYITHTHTE